MAQSELGSFQGTVKDDQGQTLEGATLYLKDLARGGEVSFKTNKKGFFYRRAIRPSEYELIIEMEGYQPFQDRLRFRAGEEKRLDFRLGAATSPAEEAFQQGLTAFNEGDYEKAAEAFEKAAQLAPDAPEAHANLGLAYLQLSRTEEGIGELEKAVALKPEQFTTQVQLASAFAQAGQLEKSVTAFEKALENAEDLSDPASFEATLNLASLYFAVGRVEEASATYERALAAQPESPDALLGLGKCHFNQGDEQKALDYFERVVSAAPDSRHATEARAVIEQFEKARKEP
jgi:tetratricopeptide (TPR) repeat protein